MARRVGHTGGSRKMLPKSYRELGWRVISVPSLPNEHEGLELTITFMTENSRSRAVPGDCLKGGWLVHELREAECRSID